MQKGEEKNITKKRQFEKVECYTTSDLNELWILKGKNFLQKSIINLKQFQSSFV